MPELPEVETTRLGLAPHTEGKAVQKMILNRRDLRWPVSDVLPEIVEGQKIVSLERRGKYLVFSMESGFMLVHLGMSGSIRVVKPNEGLRKHDHWLLRIDSNTELRFNDPRRFGALFWEPGDWQDHPLISHLGPEPLDDLFNGDYLFRASRKRTQAIKTLIMDSKIVVGVGNIYASEALFHAEVHPQLRGGKLSQVRAHQLSEQIKIVLSKAIAKGGTTLRDYVNGSGKPGYFQQELWVYGRKDLPCKNCATLIKEIRLGQRSTCFCPQCQKR